MSKRGKLVTAQAMSRDMAGQWLQVGSGADMELVQVLKARGRTVTVGRWRWYHSLLRSARRFPRLVRRIVWLGVLLPVGWKIQGLLCGVAGHKLTHATRDIYGQDLTLYCWCAKRYEYVGDPEENE